MLRDFDPRLGDIDRGDHWKSNPDLAKPNPLPIRSHAQYVVVHCERQSNFESSTATHEVVKVPVDDAHCVFESSVAARQVKSSHRAQPTVRGGCVDDLEWHVLGVLGKQDPVLGEDGQEGSQRSDP